MASARTVRTAVMVTAMAAATPAVAHFLEILPSADVLPEGGAVTLDLVFTHPTAGGPVMELARPQRVGVATGETVEDLTAGLAPITRQGRRAWRLERRLERPGGVTFFVEPQPYWEAAEKKWIIHYAKVFVDAFASGEGWHEAVGLPVEIEPLTRPTGVWTGQIFRGIVRRDGAPVPFAEVEIEWVSDGSVALPNDAFATQVIRADGAGVFAQALPRAGWWGFAALVDGPARVGPNGETAASELGGLVWVKATDMGATNMGATNMGARAPGSDGAGAPQAK